MTQEQKKGIAVVVGVVVLAGLALWALLGLLARDEPATETLVTRVEVERVVNGHYVKLDDDDEEKLIYAGIRAPYENEPMHEESKKRNEELVVGQEVRLRYELNTKRDRDERLWAYVFVDDKIFVNEAMVREGLAYARITPDVTRFAEQLMAAQQQARAARRGIWSAQSPSSEASYPADPKYAEFHRPDCEVAQRIKPERLVTFASKAAAFDQGMCPCNKCNP